jgi:hypothetical protein
MSSAGTGHKSEKKNTKDTHSPPQTGGRGPAVAGAGGWSHFLSFIALVYSIIIIVVSSPGSAESSPSATILISKFLWLAGGCERWLVRRLLDLCVLELPIVLS